MYRFEHIAPLDTTTYAEPPVEDRSGTPLSQGLILTLIGTVASEHCSDETLELITQLEPEAWYHGQVLEHVLHTFEQQHADLPAEIGKNVYYVLRSKFVEMGLREPADVIQTLPILWNYVTRGDSGAWRAEMLGPTHARLEMEQPYNCLFEAGALQGALEAFDALDVRVNHAQCMRHDAPFCVLDVTWRTA